MARLSLPAVGLGCASLGRPEVEEREAQDVLRAALAAKIGYFDCAPLYGCGLAERRLGRALASHLGTRPIVSTKVGYVIDVEEGSYLAPQARRTDYSRAGVRESLSRSLDRLGLDKLDLVYIHGPDGVPDQAEHAFEALAELRQEGLVDAIGVGTNLVQTAIEVMSRCQIDALLIAGRLTLLDRRAEEHLLDECADRKVAVVAGGIFNSGILAAAAPATSKFDYATPSEHVIEITRTLAATCQCHGVSLKTAAVQFVRYHRGVTTTLLGAATRNEIAECLEALRIDVPDALWPELEAVVRSHAL